MKIKNMKECCVSHILNQAKSILNNHKILKIEDVSDWPIRVFDWSHPELERPISTLLTCSSLNRISELSFFLKKLEKLGNNSQELILFNKLILLYSKKYNEIIKNNRIRRTETPVQFLSLTNENFVIYDYGIITIEELQRNNKLKYYPELSENEEIVDALKEYDDKGRFSYLACKIESQAERNWRILFERRNVDKNITMLEIEKEIDEMDEKRRIEKQGLSKLNA